MLPDRFWAQVRENAETGCWEWVGHVSPGGYAFLRVNGVGTTAHRAAWEEFNGPIPKGLVIDHLCRIRHCVNPAHLEPVTTGVNTRRGVESRRQMATSAA